MKKSRLLLLVNIVLLSTFVASAKVVKEKNKKAMVRVEAVLDTTSVALAPDTIKADTVVADVPKDRTDTIYYDKSWRVIGNKSFASYYRLALYPADGLAPKYFKTFYMNGNVQSEGTFISLGEKSDKTSIFDGLVEYFYNSGAIQRRIMFSDGKPNGEMTDYYENGNIKEHIIMKDGLRHGIHTSFVEDGIVCRMQEYKDDRAENFYVVIDKDGNYSKYDASTSKPLLETPDISECQAEYKNGAAWPYYNKNGLILGVSNSIVKDNIGKFREVSFSLVNKSMINVDIDPAQIKIYSAKNEKRNDLDILSADEYDEKVYKKQMKNKKRSLKQKAVVEIQREDNVSENLGASVFDAGTSNTLKAFQENLIKRTTIISGNRMKYSERERENLGYLERTTVHPGEMVSGFLFVDDKKVDELHVDVVINEIIYPFVWKNKK